MRFLIEKTGYKVDPPKDYPLAGRCQLVHCHYKSTVYYDVITRSEDPVPHEHTEHRVEVVYIDKDYLRREAHRRGRVVGPDGSPVIGAAVTLVRLDEADSSTHTDSDGRYSFAVDKAGNYLVPPGGNILRVEASGLARQIIRADRLSATNPTIRLEKGAPVSGRILYKGNPLGYVEVFLVASDRLDPGFLGDWKASTDRDGRFRFNDIPKDTEYDLYFSMESLRNFGAISPRHVKVGGQALGVDVGDFEVGPSHKVAGRLTFSDGRAIPPGTTAHVGIEGGWGSQRCPVDEEGRFAVDGMPTTTATVSFAFDNGELAPKGYRVSTKNRSYDGYSYHLVGKLDQDVTDLVVLFEPDEARLANGEGSGMGEDDIRKNLARPLHGIEPGERN